MKEVSSNIIKSPKSLYKISNEKKISEKSTLEKVSVSSINVTSNINGSSSIFYENLMSPLDSNNKNKININLKNKSNFSSMDSNGIDKDLQLS